MLGHTTTTMLHAQCSHGRAGPSCQTARRERARNSGSAQCTPTDVRTLSGRQDIAWRSMRSGASARCLRADLSSRTVASEPVSATEKSFWNTWNSMTREHGQSVVPTQQAEVVNEWLRSSSRTDLDIIDVGCGAGWLAPLLEGYGRVTATDLAAEVLTRAARRWPNVRFVAGDFMSIEFEESSYDVVVSLEVLSHVADQAAFVARLRRILRPGGELMLATQNRSALELNRIPPPGEGQRRQWVNRDELIALLEPNFEILELRSITPQFNRGWRRVINSRKLAGALRRMRLDAIPRWTTSVQERRWMGWTLIVRAQAR